MQTVLREWRPQGVATEALQPIALTGSRHETRMEIEPIDVGVTRAQRHRRHVLRRVAAPAHARPRPRTKRHAPFRRRGRHRGEHRRLLRPEVRRPAALGAAREPPALEQTLHAIGPQHGYGIARRIEQVSGNALLINQGTIYASLVRLQQHRWIEAAWGNSDNNRRAKFYSLTRLGRRQLVAEEKRWTRASAIMSRFLFPAARVKP